MTFKHLFTPHEIRGLEIANRIFSTGHQTIMAENGAPGERMAAYHESRARGGAGLIIMESSRPYRDDVSAGYYLDSSTDACIPGYRMVSGAVHRHGCKIFLPRSTTAGESPTCRTVCARCLMVRPWYPTTAFIACRG